MSDISCFSFPTQMRFGAGARSTLAEFAQKHAVKRPLLVTDSGLPSTDAFRLVSEAVTRVWPGGHAAFTEVHPNPVEADVEGAFAAYTAGRCDGVLGVGGGSALDAAKAVRIKVAFPSVPLVQAALDALPAHLAPFCAVPTTAGTGSEVGRSSVITVSASNRKVVFFSPPLLADLAILDPELTVGLPPPLTAATGMDALTHALESYVCPVFHPMCDAIALEALHIIRLFLPQAYSQGDDLEARGMMLIAASMGAVAFQKDLGAAHSLAHPLSSEFGVHHGLANALVLPAVVRFNGEEDSDQYERVAATLGLDPDADPAEAVAAFLDDFNRALGITQRLRDLGVPREQLPTLATLALEDGCHLTNPRRCSEADLLRLYEEAW